MTKLQAQDGQIYDVELRPSVIVRYEDEHPGYSFFKALRAGEDLKLSDMDRFVRFMGFEGGIDEWFAKGLTIEDIGIALTGAKWMGFTGSESDSEPSQMLPAS